MKKQAQNKHREILALIKAVRESFPDAAIVYRYGACYGLYRILKEVFPVAVAFRDGDDSHIVTMIGDRFYDIKGEVLDYMIERWNGLKRLTKDEHDHWEGVVFGQRIEFMLKKYNDD